MELNLHEQIAAQSAFADSLATGETLEQTEYNVILRTLKNVHWKVEGPGGAAELLNLHPSTLRSKMRKLGIERPRFQHNLADYLCLFVAFDERDCLIRVCHTNRNINILGTNERRLEGSIASRTSRQDRPHLSYQEQWCVSR